MSLSLSQLFFRVHLLKRHTANLILQLFLLAGHYQTSLYHTLKRSLLRHPTHAQLHAAALKINFEDAHLHYLADGDDGQGIFDEAICHL
jgi:hypothetical protein